MADKPDSYAQIVKMTKVHVPKRMPVELPHVNISFDPAPMTGAHKTASSTSNIYDRIAKKCVIGKDYGKRDDMVAKSRAYDIKMYED